MNAHETASDALTPRWLHALAVLNACATFVLLLLLGSLVTTKGAGMADPIWPTYPWHLWLIGWTEPRPGFIIEHLHRLAGYSIGTITIAVVVGLCLWEPRRWVRWFGVAALAGVCIQGVLGGLRVRLNDVIGPENAVTLAIVHGCFAQIVFAMLVTLALVTSRAWQQPAPSAPGKSLLWLTLIVVGLVYTQIIFGAIVRHTYSISAVRHHLVTAFSVTIGVVWLVREACRSDDGLIRRAGYVLATVTVLQLLMGVEAFMSRFTVRSAEAQLAIRTVHVLLGFLVFSSAVGLAALARRHQPVALEPPTERETEVAFAAVGAEEHS